MPEYEMTMTIRIEADNKIQATDKLQELLGSVLPVDYSREVNGELFAELGVKYD